MSSTMMMERTGMGVPGLGMPGLGTPTVGTPTGSPVGANWLMVPRCTFKVEKCQGGIKITCPLRRQDGRQHGAEPLHRCWPAACAAAAAMLNGMTVCTCNLTMGLCKCEMTENGVCITCTSGDPKCCEMIQACCDCLACCLRSRLHLLLLINNTPVCCGYSESSKHSPKTKAGR